MSLLGVKKKNRESLRECVLRFNLEALEVANLTISDTVEAFLKGLKEGPFQLSLSKKALRDKADLITRVEKYINSKEILKYLVGIEVPKVDPITVELALKRKMINKDLKEMIRGQYMTNETLENPNFHH